MLLVFGIFPTSYNSLSMAKDTSMAANFAREWCERLRVRGFFDAENDPGTYGPIPLRGRCKINGMETETDFELAYEVATLSPSKKSIVVTVSWTVGSKGANSNAMNRSVRVGTYVTEH